MSEEKKSGEERMQSTQELLNEFVEDRGWTILDLRLVERGISPIPSVEEKLTPEEKDDLLYAYNTYLSDLEIETGNELVTTYLMAIGGAFTFKSEQNKQHAMIKARTFDQNGQTVMKRGIARKREFLERLLDKGIDEIVKEGKELFSKEDDQDKKAEIRKQKAQEIIEFAEFIFLEARDTNKDGFTDLSERIEGIVSTYNGVIKGISVDCPKHAME